MDFNQNIVRLPTMEIVLYVCVWIGHVLYALIDVASLSHLYGARIQYDPEFLAPGWFLGRFKDKTNYEWSTWMEELANKMPLFLLHAVGFNFSSVIGQIHLQKAFHLCLWLIIHLYYYRTRLMLITACVGLVMFLLAHSTRSKALLWLCMIPCVSYLCVARGRWTWTEEVFMSYKLLQYMSFNLDLVDSPVPRSPFISQLFDLSYYSLYWPFTVALFVPYHEFKDRLDNPNPRDWSSIVLFGVRTLLWTFVAELALHFFYMNAMMQDDIFLGTLGRPTVAAIGYLCGQFFHLIYISYFGVPAFFARIDGLSPPGPPVCVSRVSLYSNMWRYFDRGLYSFFCIYIYRPFLTKFYDSWAKIVASALCFGFVWLWHGGTHLFAYWLTANFLELSLERACESLWRWNRQYLVRLSAPNRRRLSALIQIPCAVLGILSIFFFLSNKDTGMVFVRTFVTDTLLTVSVPALHLYVLLYCYCQCCLEMEHIFGYK